MCLLNENFKAYKRCVKQAKSNADVFMLATSHLSGKINTIAIVIIGEMWVFFLTWQLELHPTKFIFST